MHFLERVLILHAIIMWGAGHGFWGRSFSEAMGEINKYLVEIGVL